MEVIGVKRKVLFLYRFPVLSLTFPCFAWAWSGKVVGVADGDTIKVLRDNEQVRIRFYGIDCPEGG